MAQANYTPIQLYYSTTTTNVPSAGDLVDGELAINTADGKLFYKDSLGAVQTLATKAVAGITITGNYTLDFTLTGNTSVTLPTSGTLATKGNALAYSIVFGL